jgi:phosphoribosylformylglycinamidine cyclo-ligase
MAAVVAAGDADRAVRWLTQRGLPAWTAGEIVATAGEPATARLTGSHEG